jgi:DNA-directed RNA polymerase subunit RPC12/RpoP
MAGVPLKFRCYQCNQLLGVSPSKAGSVVACPRCGVELIVPQPPEPGSAGSTDSAPAASEALETNAAPAAPGGLDTGTSLESLDIRPEDIRVEPGFEWAPRPTEAERVELPEDRPAPTPAAAPAATPPQSAVEEPTPSMQETPPWVAAPEVPPEAAETVVPPIRVEPPRVAEPRSALAPRSRDVVLSRSTVAAWSLFVLLAQAFAFLAGLLAGHFVWRVH